MARLPIPGSDSGQWGTILNDFLSQSHTADGKLKTDSVTAAQLASGSVVNSAIANGAVTTAKIADGTVTSSKLDASAQASLVKADTALQPGGLALVATSGAYSDLSGQPTLGTAASTNSTDYAPALGLDENYVTDVEKAALHAHSNKTALDLVSGTNTGDQTLSGLGGAPASGQATVNALTAAATVTVPATHSMHTLTMTQNTTLVFSNPTAGHAFTLKLSGAFTPTFPASVSWAGGSAPTYASGKVYVFATFDAGTSWIGSAL